MNTAFAAAIDAYLEHIRADYAKWQNLDRRDLSDNQRQIREEMIQEFNDKLRVEWGKKFIKVIQNNGVHTFIVIEDGGKWKAGDILKAASWKAPAQNFKRGNILEGKIDAIRWTGA